VRLTDRVLAALPEQALADRARKLRPGIRVLYMSGSPASAPEPAAGRFRSSASRSPRRTRWRRCTRQWPPPRSTDVSCAQAAASDGSVTSMITASAAYSRSAEPGGLMLISGTNAGAFTAAGSLVFLGFGFFTLR
jgi:hypothetical protein